MSFFLGLILLLTFAGCTSNPSSDPVEENTAEATEASEHSAETLDWSSVPASYSVTAARGYAYLGLGSELLIIDLSSFAEPREMGSITLDGPIRDIVVSENLAYVAGSASGLHVVDVATPETPRLLNSIATDDRCEAIDVVDTYLYIAARTSGLNIFDISDPERPEQIGALQTLEEAMDVRVQDSFALVAASFGGLRVIDVSNPEEPQEIGFATRGSYDQGYAWSVAVQDDYAYVANVEIGLRSVDISEPTEARTEGLYGLATFADEPYAPVSVAGRGRYVYLADQSAGLRIIDVADPEEMEEVSQIDIPGRAMDVEIREEVAFVASQTGGLRVIDVSNPIRPEEIGFYDPTVVADRIYTLDGRYFVIDRNDLIREVDLQNLSTPIQLDQYSAAATEVIGQSEYLYVADSENIRIIHTPPLGRIVGVASVSLPSIEYLALDGNILYALNDEGIVSQIDVSLPERPRLLPDQIDVLSAREKQMDPAGPFASTEVGAVEFDDSRLYVTIGEQVLTFGLSSAEGPEFLGAASFQGRPWSIWIEHNSLLILTDTGLFLFDLSENQQPRLVVSTRTRALSGVLFPDREEVWVAEVQGTVRSFSYADGKTLTPAGSIYLPHRVTGISLFEGSLLLAAGEGGLGVLNIGDPASPQLATVWTSIRNQNRSRADGNQMAASPR